MADPLENQRKKDILRRVADSFGENRINDSQKPR